MIATIDRAAELLASSRTGWSLAQRLGYQSPASSSVIGVAVTPLGDRVLRRSEERFLFLGRSHVRAAELS